MAARKDHRCDWRDRAEALQAELKVARDELDRLREKTGLLDEKIDALNQKMFGRRSERQRVPDINAEIRKQRPADPEQAKAKRRATDELKKQVEAEPHRPEVPRPQCYSSSRSGDTPKKAQRAIDLYTEVFVVERDARELSIVGSRQHLALRKKRSAPAMQRMHAWPQQEQPRHLPKSKVGDAIAYALNNWKELTRFLQRRIVALGRKNYMSVGAESAGQSIATLCTLTACCKRMGIEPIAYLTDMLRRLGRDPDCSVDELMPHRWKPLDTS